jgi:hypothetical protein
MLGCAATMLLCCRRQSWSTYDSGVHIRRAGMHARCRLRLDVADASQQTIDGAADCCWTVCELQLYCTIFGFANIAYLWSHWRLLSLKPFSRYISDILSTLCSWHTIFACTSASCLVRDTICRPAKLSIFSFKACISAGSARQHVLIEGTCLFEAACLQDV